MLTTINRGELVQQLQDIGYPKWVDKPYPFLKGYKVPKFTQFIGEDNHTILKSMMKFFS